jgi:hypothetical protein
MEIPTRPKSVGERILARATPARKLRPWREIILTVCHLKPLTVLVRVDSHTDGPRSVAAGRQSLSGKVVMEVAVGRSGEEEEAAANDEDMKQGRP